VCLFMPHSNKWKGDPIGFVNAMKGPPKVRFMKQRNKLHHHLEAGKTEAIAGIITSCIRVVVPMYVVLPPQLTSRHPRSGLCESSTLKDTKLLKTLASEKSSLALTVPRVTGAHST
jgi:hypothetical protein